MGAQEYESLKKLIKQIQVRLQSIQRQIIILIIGDDLFA